MFPLYFETESVTLLKYKKIFIVDDLDSGNPTKATKLLITYECMICDIFNKLQVPNRVTRVVNAE